MLKGDKFVIKFDLSSSIYIGFINLFKDKNPLHTDESFAKSKGFENKVMHGNILNGFVSFFIGECLPLKNVIIQKQEIKFLNPVYEQDTLELNAEIMDVFESVNTIEFKYNFTNMSGKKVASGKIQIGLLL